MYKQNQMDDRNRLNNDLEGRRPLYFVVYFLIIIWLGGCVCKFSILIEKLKKWNPSLNTLVFWQRMFVLCKECKCWRWCYCVGRAGGGTMLGDVNISGTLDSFSVNYDKRVRPNYGSEYLPQPLSLTHSLFPRATPSIMFTINKLTLGFLRWWKCYERLNLH